MGAVYPHRTRALPTRIAEQPRFTPMKIRIIARLQILTGLLLILAGSSLSGCNTVKGAGQDIKSAGQAIEKTAQQTKPY